MHTGLTKNEGIYWNVHTPLEPFNGEQIATAKEVLHFVHRTKRKEPGISLEVATPLNCEHQVDSLPVLTDNRCHINNAPNFCR